MIIEIVMPKMGESITEGTIIEWRKKPGEAIEKDEILLEIGTDKVDSEIPSSHRGIITELLAKPNDVIDVGKVIARIETEEKLGVQIIEETGLPGNPIIGVFFNMPNIRGLPGLIVIFQNLITKPKFNKAFLIRSFFPIETPPIVIIKSYL